MKHWERIHAKELPATEQSTTDKPISLPDIYFLIFYTLAGLGVAIVLLLTEICFRRLQRYMSKLLITFYIMLGMSNVV